MMTWTEMITTEQLKSIQEACLELNEDFFEFTGEEDNLFELDSTLFDGWVVRFCGSWRIWSQRKSDTLPTKESLFDEAAKIIDQLATFKGIYLAERLDTFVKNDPRAKVYEGSVNAGWGN